jgi:cytochrome P450
MASSRSAVSKEALAIGAACFLAVREILRRWRLRGTPPGSLGLPVIGESIDYILNPFKFVEDRKRRYGPIFKTGILFSPTVQLTGEYSKLIMKNPSIGWPQHFIALLGDTAMAAINGPRHKFQRAICNAAFTDQALASYVPDLEAMTRKHLDLWVAKSSRQGPYDPHEDIKLYTFEIAERILMGTSGCGALVAPFNTWLEGFEAVLPFDLPFTCFGKAMRARATLLEEYQRVIDAKRAAGSYESGRDMLSMVMKEGKRGEPMTDEELKDFSISIMFAGHDTTKATIQSMIHFLAEKPGIREELEKEVSMVWDGKSPLTFEQTQACQVGKCGRFCAEILRVLPVVSSLYRLVTEETEIGGYRIPKGWKLSVSIPDMHQAQDIDMSVDHSTLKQTENCAFGLGNRMCLGYRFAKLELIVWLMCTLRNYEVSMVASKEIVFPFHYMNVRASFSSKTS